MSWVLKEKKSGPLAGIPRPPTPKIPKPPAPANPEDVLRPPKPPPLPGYEWVWKGPSAKR